MPIDSVYADSTNAYGDGQNAAGLPDQVTPPPSTTIGSISRAVARGVGQGGASLLGGTEDLTAGLSQAYSDPEAGNSLTGQAFADQRANDAVEKLQSGDLFASRLGTNAYDFASSLKPDPNTSTTIDQVVQGAVSGLTQIVPATLAGGPLAGAAVGGASLGLAKSEDLKRQGVDVGTRTAVGALSGVAGGAGALVPVAGSTLASTAGLVLAAGPGATVAQSAAEKAILKNANYDHLADQIDPLDPTSLAASLVIPAVFGGAHLIGGKLAGSSADAAPTVAPRGTDATALSEMPLAARKALPYSSPVLDDYATQVAQRDGVPASLLLFIKNKGEMSNSNQTSPAGAKGVMQFTDSTWGQYGNGGDRTDPIASIDAAGRYAKDLLTRYNGDARAAVTEYNGGIEQARAVQAGGAPTAAETVAYLQRYDQFAAEHAINNTPFNPTADQVDAALGAHSQRIVDEAHSFGTPGDPADTAIHQDAFELAARQMDNGDVPDVTSLIPETEFNRANALDGLIANAESFRSDLAATAGNLAEPGAISTIRQQLDDLQAGAPDGSPAGVKALASQYQDTQRLSYKQALSRAQKDTAAALDAHDQQIQRLQGLLDRNAEANQAHQQLGVIDSHLSDMRAAREQIDAPYTRQTAISKAVRGIDPAAVRAEKISARAAERAQAEAVPGNAPPGEALTDAGTPTAAVEPQNVPAGSAEAQPVSPVEANLREHAATDTTTQYQVDTNAGPQTGTAAQLLQTIDDEHAATTQDADLLTVAAQCFIS